VPIESGARRAETACGEGYMDGLESGVRKAEGAVKRSLRREMW
jgi:hypothetical protein